eukprot:1151693-Pelagomonas_calceolata.AAC.4
MNCLLAVSERLAAKKESQQHALNAILNIVTTCQHKDAHPHLHALPPTSLGARAAQTRALRHATKAAAAQQGLAETAVGAMQRWHAHPAMAFCCHAMSCEAVQTALAATGRTVLVPERTREGTEGRGPRVGVPGSGKEHPGRGKGANGRGLHGSISGKKRANRSGQGVCSSNVPNLKEPQGHSSEEARVFRGRASAWLGA